MWEPIWALLKELLEAVTAPLGEDEAVPSRPFVPLPKRRLDHLQNSKENTLRKLASAYTGYHRSAAGVPPPQQPDASDLYGAGPSKLHLPRIPMHDPGSGTDPRVYDWLQAFSSDPSIPPHQKHGVMPTSGLPSTHIAQAGGFSLGDTLAGSQLPEYASAPHGVPGSTGGQYEPQLPQSALGELGMDGNFSFFDNTLAAWSNAPSSFG